MSKQVAIIGLGRFGSNLATILYNAGYEILAIDKSAELVEDLSEQVTHAVRADAVEEAALKKLGIDRFDVAVVTVASVQDSVIITILLKKMGVKYIVARADNELHGEILRSIGAHKVIFPEKDTAIRTGPVLTIEGVADYIPLANGSGVVKARATPFFIGKTLGDIGFGTGSKGGVVVLMIQRGKEGLIYPSLEEVVSHVDVLIMAGNNSDIEKLMELADKHLPAKET